MKTFNIATYKAGWFIGDFAPTLAKTSDFEIAHHFYKKGFVGEPHFHKIATEYNYIVRGKVSIDGSFLTVLGSGDGFVFEPNEYEKVTYLEDTDLIIIKTPSVPGDKYIIKKNGRNSSR